jgi:uncharacterized membrane protein
VRGVSIAAVTGYNVALFLHITAVVVGFGATFAESVTFPVAMKLDRRHLPYVHRLHLAINAWLATPALVLVLATGFYQVADGDWDLGKFWISASLTIVLVLGGLIGAYLIPADRRLAARAERELAAGGDLSEDYQRQARTTGIVGGVAGVLVVVAIFLMVTKPGV